uniref:Uncharacterized protein n=1 Tax=Meloidogyne enterolobii TaxID=390850 RepID=A0A6V7VQQ1_MELEN|nr:unnamed protein product [Meloidogyne enterolobii]
MLDLSHPGLRQFYFQQRLFFRQIYDQQLAALSARLGLIPLPAIVILHFLINTKTIKISMDIQQHLLKNISLPHINILVIPSTSNTLSTI